MRILDVAHACDSLTRGAKAAFGESSPAASSWAHARREQLRSGEPEPVIEALRALHEPALQRGGSEAVEVVSKEVGYLSDRVEMMRYRALEAAGLPIGSGAVESANKVVIEARLKGAGMRWAAENVTAMATVRTMSSNGRWDEEWAQVKGRWRTTRRQRKAERRERKALAQPHQPATPKATPRPRAAKAATRKAPSRPAAEHPWKRFPAVRSAKRLAAYQPSPGK